MINIKNLILKLNATDLVVVCFYFILSAINIIFCVRIDIWHWLVLINTAIICTIFFLASKDQSNKIAHFLHRWYIIPLIFVTFKELYFMISPIHGKDYDYIFISIDQFIFGANPTQALYSITKPLLTEILQIAYFLFYLMMIALAVDLHIQKKQNQFSYTIFSLVFGFFLSYLGYLLLPAIGPRFTLHEFVNLNNELPGVTPIVNFLREIINRGEGITSYQTDAAQKVMRDVFPSGHTQMTLITMFLAIKFKTKTRYFLILNGILLLFATIYMRYHYFTDLIGGLIFMILTMWLGIKIYNFWMKKTNNPIFEYNRN